MNFAFNFFGGAGEMIEESQAGDDFERVENGTMLTCASNIAGQLASPFQ